MSDLWKRATAVDPKFTKDFLRSGGFKGTAVNPTYIIMRASEIFGPAGIGWGWNIIEDRYDMGASILSADGVVLGQDSIHVVKIKLWYKWQGERGEIEHFGQTTFSGRNSKGLFTDEEAPKKSLTDAITKALSCLGFASEIHMGRWDDSKYIRTKVDSDVEPAREESLKTTFGGNGDKPKEKEIPVTRDPALFKRVSATVILDEQNKPISFFKEAGGIGYWKKMAVQAAMTPVFNDLRDCTDESSLDGLLASKDTQIRLDICKVVVPFWHTEFMRRLDEIRNRKSSN